MLVAAGVVAMVAAAAVPASTPGIDPANGSWVGGEVLQPGSEQLVLWNVPGTAGVRGTCITAGLNGPLHGPYRLARTIPDPVYGELNHLFASVTTSDVRIAELSALNSRKYDLVDRGVDWSYLVNGTGGTSVADAQAMLDEASRLAGPYRIGIALPKAAVEGVPATVTVTVASAAGVPIAGARVSVHATGATLGSGTLTTGHSGTATVKMVIGHDTSPRYSISASAQSWTDIDEYGSPGEQEMLSSAAPTTQSAQVSASAVRDREVDLVKVGAHDATHAPQAGYRYRISDAGGAVVASVTTDVAPVSLGRLRIGATYTATEFASPANAALYIPTNATSTFTVPAGSATWTIAATDPEVPKPAVRTRVGSATPAPGQPLTDTVTISGDDGESGSLLSTLYGPVAPPKSGRCAGLALAAFLTAASAHTTTAIDGTVDAGNGDVVVTLPGVHQGGCYGWSQQLTLSPSGAVATSTPADGDETALVVVPTAATPKPHPSIRTTPRTPASTAPRGFAPTPEAPLAKTGTAMPVGRTVGFALGLLFAGLGVIGLTPHRSRQSR